MYPDGRWAEYVSYDSEGRLLAVYLPQINTTISVSAADNTVGYMYDPIAGTTDDGTMYPNVPRWVDQKVNGEETEKYTVFPTHFERIDVDYLTGDWYDYSVNPSTITTYYPSGPNTNRVQSVQHPDGTMQIYTYVQAADGTQTNTVYSGVPNSGLISIVDGTESITVLGPVGQMVSRTQIDLASGITTALETYGNYDQFSRPQCVTYLDGTSNVTIYACCGVDTTIDRDGVPTYYQYDAAKRLVATTRLGVTTSYTLDSLGHVVETARTGTDLSIVTLSKSQYDLSGQLIAETNALGGVTTYSEGLNSFGGLVRTTTYPDTGTRIEQYNLDRSLASVTGTAVHAKMYEYGMEAAPDLDIPYTCGFTMETDLDSSGNPTGEWTKTYTDPFGRMVEILYADKSHSLSYYNTASQLINQVDPDGVSTLYQYGPNGQVAYTAIDMEKTGAIDWGGIDRITWTTNDVTYDHGTAVKRSRTYVWLDGQSSGTLGSVSETSVDGLKSWQLSYSGVNTALTNQTTTSYLGNSRTVTSTAPEGSYTVNSYASGQLLSSTRYDANTHQIGATSYTYDPHGRQYQVTDARNGTTMYGYNAADQVATATSPAPGNAPAQTTTTLYDTMLRPYSVIQPDSTTVNTTYLLTGELGQQSGSRTYPVAYSYDYAGRMQTMTTWSSFGNPATARVTTWVYDGQRGWLNQKTYADGNGPTYTYTPAGRPQSRAWMRTDGSGNPITTTYGYDPAGGLATVGYSDSTPGVTYTCDRLGRQNTVTWNGITDTLAYNLAGQLLIESFSGGLLDGLSATNGYDQFLRRTNLTALKSNNPFIQQSYGFDAASRLLTVNDDNNNVATYSYLANSPLVSQITFQQNSATRMTTTKQYDDLNRLTAISSQPSGTGVPPVSFNYAYNSANQRTQDKLADGSYWVYLTFWR
jgi:YD repeat-containing protein